MYFSLVLPFSSTFIHIANNHRIAYAILSQFVAHILLSNMLSVRCVLKYVFNLASSATQMQIHCLVIWTQAKGAVNLYGVISLWCVLHKAFRLEDVCASATPICNTAFKQIHSSENTADSAGENHQGSWATYSLVSSISK